MKQKRILAVLLALIMIFAAACGDTEKADSTETRSKN